MGAFLHGKTVLFVGPVFYGYTREIVAGLERLGARVRFVNEQPTAGVDPFYSLFKKLPHRALAAYCNAFLHHRLNALRHEAMDLVFVLRGETITPDILAELRRRYPRARFVYYNWDSVAVKPNALRIQPFFDAAFSFDRADCERYPQFTYQPTFFLPLFQPQPGPPPPVDLLFVGNSHSDRLWVLNQVADQLRREGLTFDARILVPRWKPRLGGETDPLRPFYIRKTVSLETVKTLMLRSRAVLDIHHRGQSGLTQRTFEALNMGLKLITTNERIRQEPFYDPRQIQLLDRTNPRVDPAFLRAPSLPLDLSAYSLEAWLTAVLAPAAVPNPIAP